MSLTGNTIFANTKLPLTKWFRQCTCCHKPNRLISDGAKAPVGVKYDTARMSAMLPQAMKESDDKQPISGIIQPDDVYWGGERRWQTGRGAAGKTPFAGSRVLEQGRTSNQDADDGGRWFQNQVRC